MSRFLAFALIASAPVFGQLRSERVAVDFDSQLRPSIRWLAQKGNGIVARDPAAAPGIEVNGWNLSGFPRQPRACEPREESAGEFGAASTCTVTGTYANEDRGIRIERRVRVLLPKSYADLALFEQSYRNLGERPVHIGTVRTQDWVLDRRLEEPDQPAHAFASFQGGAYKWGLDYDLIWLQPGFHQTNFQGLDDRTGPEGEGGGMPFIDVWSPAMGMAIAHIEKAPQWVSLPVDVRPDGLVEIGLTERPLEKFMQKEWLKPGETYQTVLSALIFHHGDFHDALRAYGDLLRARGIRIPVKSQPEAYEPYWKSWGFEFAFTPQKIYDALPGLRKMGIHVANLDDGWFDWYGDWMPNRKPDKFPGGEADLKAFTRRMHSEGFQSAAWWYPLGVSPESVVAKEHPELLVMDEHGNFPKDDRNVYQFCPAYEPARKHIAATLRRILADYGFDSVYLDSTGQTAVPPCYNPAHHHASPLDSFQNVSAVYQMIDRETHALKPHAALEVCICGLPHSPYLMPYYATATASDPVNSAQMRRRIKLEKAIRGPQAAVGDCYQVPVEQWKGSAMADDFESSMGTGAQMTTFYSALTKPEEVRWDRWFHMYRELGLSTGEYLNLYDIAFDHPEGHVVRKGADLYYGFFAEAWNQARALTLRGLDSSKTYEVYDYANERSLGTVKGSDPRLNVGFKGSLLLRLRPVR